MTTREAKRQATRERLFVAAVAEFKRAGLSGADVGAIVSEAGVVKAIERDRARVLLGPDVRTLDVIARILPGRTGLIGRALDRFVKS